MRLALILTLPLLAACVAADGPADPYPFVGSWDCGDNVLTLTQGSYADGTGTYPIRSVSPEGRSYTLSFGDGTLIALAAVTDTGLTWVSGTTGEQRTCRRVN